MDHMIRVRRLTAVLLVTLGLVALPASASAHEFVASKTGKTTSKAKSTQEFYVNSKLLCGEVKSAGEAPTGSAKTRKETVTYSNCEWAGYPKIAIEPVHFEFNAEGSVKIENRFEISPLGAECHWWIPAQTLPATYGNEAGAVTTRVVSNGFRYESSGRECGTVNIAGFFYGVVLTSLEGGTLQWK